MQPSDRVALTRIRLFSDQPLNSIERRLLADEFTRQQTGHLAIHPGRENGDEEERWAKHVTPMALYTPSIPTEDRIRSGLARIESLASATATGRVRARARRPEWISASQVDQGDLPSPSRTSWMAPMRPLTHRDREGRMVRSNPEALGIEEKYLRRPMEEVYASELRALQAVDKGARPPGWNLSPLMVEKYITGTKEVKTAEGKPITTKFVGPKRLLDVAISTIGTDRALLLVGEPGTAKSWLSEHLAAAISGDSQQIIQGTAGTTEEMVRYSWNYAMLLAHGPRPEALVPSPIFRCMQRGKIARFEEITRVPAEIQDALITIMSEKTIVVPELDSQVRAVRGFNIIATANTRDRGINEMSAALKRRFNIVLIPLPTDLKTEVAIVRQRVEEIGTNLQMPASPPSEAAVQKIVTIFQELRRGQTLDGKTVVASPTAVLSTAEAISSLVGAMALAAYFGSGVVTDEDLAASVYSTITRDDPKDITAYETYLERVLRQRPEYASFFAASKTFLA